MRIKRIVRIMRYPHEAAAGKEIERDRSCLDLNTLTPPSWYYRYGESDYIRRAARANGYIANPR